MSALKPCPFCGGQAFLKHAGIIAAGDAYYIECDHCEIGTNIDVEERVVAAWNRRAEDDHPDCDGTDAAHPAWWRGHEAGAASLCAQIARLLDGEKVVGVCAEPWETTRQRITTLRAELAAAQSN